MKQFRLPILLLALVTSACSGSDFKDTMGLSRQAPDEFVVVSRPPLSMPPEFDLQPPHPGAHGPQQVTTEDQAHKVLTGQDTPAASLDAAAAPASPTSVDPVVASDTPDAATSNFLKRAGTDKAHDSIRDKLTEDAMVTHTAPGKTLYEQMINSKDPNEPVVDAPKEAERLRDNKDNGKPANEGDVPVEQDKPKSVIDEIF